MEIALIVFITAAIFTFVGHIMSIRYLSIKMTTTVINTLIQDGYLKVKGTGVNQEILKHDEE